MCSPAACNAALGVSSCCQQFGWASATNAASHAAAHAAAEPVDASMPLGHRGPIALRTKRPQSSASAACLCLSRQSVAALVVYGRALRVCSCTLQYMGW